MTAFTQFLDLLVTEGPDKGMRFSVEQSSYRIIGKREVAEKPSVLNLNQHEIVNRHIKTYSDFSSLQFQARGPNISLSDNTLNRVHAIFLFNEKRASCADLTGGKRSIVTK